MVGVPVILLVLALVLFGVAGYLEPKLPQKLVIAGFVAVTLAFLLQGGIVG